MQVDEDALVLEQVDSKALLFWFDSLVLPYRAKAFIECYTGRILTKTLLHLGIFGQLAVTKLEQSIIEADALKLHVQGELLRCTWTSS